MEKDKTKYKVICGYDGPFGERGEILSRHKSYELAKRAMKKIAPGQSVNWLAIELPEKYVKF